MCQTSWISACFSVVYLIFIIYYFKKKPFYWKEYIIFSGFYMIMEIFQTLQWSYGDVYNKSDIYGLESCSPINKNFTYFAYILIWVQPILFSYLGQRTTNGDYNLIFKKLTIINLIVFIWSILTLFLGNFEKNFYLIEDSIFAFDTCTSIGKSGHLAWQFKPNTIDYQANHLTYLILCFLSFCVYPDNELKIIGFGWFISLIISSFYFTPTEIEKASVWCLSSIFANLTIIGFLIIKSNYINLFKKKL